MDLAVGHVAAVRKMADPQLQGWKPYNLGTGNGNSVLEVVQAFEAASGKKIPYEFAPRRDGDIAVTYADCSLAAKELGWKAEKTLADMCKRIANINLAIITRFWGNARLNINFCFYFRC